MGLFDSAGERLYKEMDRAMRDLKAATPSIQSEVVVRTADLISRIQADADRWSAEGKQKAGRELQAQAKRQRDFDIASYVTKFLAGAWLEAIVMQDDVHARHILVTIEALLSAEGDGAPQAQAASHDFGPLVERCLAIVLAAYFAEKTVDLQHLLRSLRGSGEPVIDRAHALALGMIDGLTQMKNMSQTAHLAAVTAFFLTYIDDDPTVAARIVGKLIRIVPGNPLFSFVQAGGQAMVKFTSTQDVDEFMNLADLLRQSDFLDEI